MAKKPQMDLSQLGYGAVGERFENDLQKVLKNVDDPNTKADAVRSITLTVSIKPGKNRQSASITVGSSVRLAPPMPIETEMLIGKEKDGTMVGRELLSGEPGQAFMDDDGKVRSDVGEEIKPDEDQGGSKQNVVQFK